MHPERETQYSDDSGGCPNKKNLKASCIQIKKDKAKERNEDSLRTVEKLAYI